jgi:hypothetical protein
MDRKFGVHSKVGKLRTVVKMRQRDAEVLEFHDLLEQTICGPHAFSIVELPLTALDASWRRHSRTELSRLEE